MIFDQHWSVIEHPTTLVYRKLDNFHLHKITSDILMKWNELWFIMQFVKRLHAKVLLFLKNKVTGVCSFPFCLLSYIIVVFFFCVCSSFPDH